MEDKSIFPIGNKGSRDWASHMLSYQDARAMIEAFRGKDHAMESFHKSVEFGPWFYSVTWHNKAIKALMAQPKAVATRSYLALHNERVTLVLVAVDKDGKDVPYMAMNAGVLCPPNCIGDPW